MNAQTKTLLKETAIFAGLLGVALLVTSFFVDPAFATSLIDSSDNPSAISGATGGENNIKDLALTIVNFFLGFLGFIATLMVIYGGVLYVTSAGNEDNVGKAKNILLYAAIGIVIILASFAFINTILGAALGGGGATSGTAT